MTKLTEQLQEWFSCPLDKLPENIRAIVQADFIIWPWESLDEDRRRRAAALIDAITDPVAAEQSSIWAKLLADKDALKIQICDWEKASCSTVTEFELKTRSLNELNDRFGKLSDQLQQSRGDYLEETLPEATYRPETLAAANSICESEPQQLNSRASPICEPFRTLQDLTPDELTIKIVGDRADQNLSGNSMLEVTARDITRRVSLAEIDLVDRRQGNLNAQAAILVGLAAKMPVTTADPNNSKRMERLRSLLKNHFALLTDPFYRHTKRIGWQPKFNIVDDRGLTETRAKETAEKMMKSLNQLEENGKQIPSKSTVDNYTFEDEEDEAGRFLRDQQ